MIPFDPVVVMAGSKVSSAPVVRPSGGEGGMVGPA